MLIVINGSGFLMVMAAVALAGGVFGVLGVTNHAVITFVATLFVLVIDLAYRGLRGSTLFGRAGGRLFFLPLWLWSAAAVVAHVVDFVAHPFR
jgi:hypothetical protein